MTAGSRPVTMRPSNYPRRGHLDHLAVLVEVERFSFYERARSAFAILATSETAIYANMILKKGLVTAGPSGKP